MEIDLETALTELGTVLFKHYYNGGDRELPKLLEHVLDEIREIFYSEKKSSFSVNKKKFENSSLLEESKSLILFLDTVLKEIINNPEFDSLLEDIGRNVLLQFLPKTERKVCYNLYSIKHTRAFEDIYYHDESGYNHHRPHQWSKDVIQELKGNLTLIKREVLLPEQGTKDSLAAIDSLLKIKTTGTKELSSALGTALVVENNSPTFVLAPADNDPFEPLSIKLITELGKE